MQSSATPQSTEQLPQDLNIRKDCGTSNQSSACSRLGLDLQRWSADPVVALTFLLSGKEIKLAGH